MATRPPPWKRSTLKNIKVYQVALKKRRGLDLVLIVLIQQYVPLHKNGLMFTF